MKNHLSMLRHVAVLLLAIVAMTVGVSAQTTCQIKIVGEDSYGDGWNSGSLAVVQGGTTIATFNAANADDGGMMVGAYDSTTVSVNADSAVSFVWTSGNYDDEVTIWIYDGGGSLVFTVNDPNPGTIYTLATPCPSCMPPQGLTATITGSDVDITWTDSLNSVWQIVWGSGAFNPDTVTTNTDYAYTGSYSFYGLSDGSYTFYVRADCGGDTSNWASVSVMLGGCIIRIVGADSFGDGWNGGSLAVVQGGTTIQTVTMTNGSNVTAQVPVASSPAVNFVWSTGSFDSEVTINIYDGTNALVYTVSNPTAGTLYTMVQPCPTCFPPQGLVATNNGTDIDLSWNAGTASTWEIVWGTGLFDPDTVTVNTTIVTSNAYTFTGFADGSYTAYVRTLCDAGDTSVWVSVPFMIGGCMLKIVGEDGYADGWNGGSLAIVQGGTTIATFNAANADNDGMGPALDSVLVGVTSGLPVSFVWTTGTYDDEVTIWIYHSSGVLLYTVNEPSAGTIFTIGDACNGCFAPSGLTVDSLSNNFARLAWSGNATSYGIEWNELGNSPVATTTTDTHYDLSGLTSGTTYVFRVWSDCGDGTSDTMTLTVTTIGDPITVFPYTTGFELGDDMAWSFVNDAINAWAIDTAASNSGSRALYISNNGGADNAYTTSSSQFSYAYRALQITDSGQYSISFDWRGYGEGNYDFLRAWIAPASTMLTAGHTPDGGTNSYDYTTATPTGWIDLGGKKNLSNTWQQVVGTPYLSAGNHILVFMWANDGSGGTQPPIAIDNVDIRMLTCPMPINVGVGSATTNQITFEWNAGGSETQWAVSVDGGAWTIVSDSTYTATGLTANTPYSFSVRAVCGAGDSSTIVTIGARTECDAVTLPFTEDFETQTTGSSTTGSAFPNCWTRINNGTAYGGYPYVSSSSTYNHTAGGSKGLYWYASTTAGTYGDYMYVVLPAIDTTLNPINTLQLTFWAKASSSSYNVTLEVGVMDNVNDTAIEVLGTVNIGGNTSWQEYIVPLNNHVAAGSHVAIRALRPSSYWYAYVDDITLGPLPTCPRVENVHASAAGATSVTVDWTDVAPATEWQLRYGVAGGTPTTVTVSSHPYTVSGLDSLTSYNFEVRPVCSVGDTGEWCQPATLSTEICDNALAASTGNASGTSYTVPVNNFYNYTLSETIIDSAELVGLGEIMAIAYSYNYSTASTDKTDVTIWLQPTDKSVFASSSDIILLDTTIATQVYHGNLNCSQGWNYFQFTNSYIWNGQGNLVVIVDDNSHDYNSSSYVFNTSSCNGYKTLVWYSDSYHPDPTSSSYNGSKTYYQYRPTMKLVSCGGCSAPIIASVNKDYESATITVVGSGNSFELEYGLSLAALSSQTTSTTGVFNLTGLTPATQYFFRVRQECDANEMSGWTEGYFTTDSLPCMAVTNLQVTGTSYNSVSLSWTAGGDESAWEVSVYSTVDTVNVTSQTANATVTGLMPQRAYSAVVRPMCGSNHNIEGPWCDPVTFTTDACQPVSDVTVSNIGATVATVSWTAPTGATNFRVAYGFTGFSQGEELDIYNTTTNPFALTDLEANTGYTVQVAVVCTENLVSSYVGADFTTTNVGIDGADMDNALSLYPNPASSMVTLRVGEKLVGSTMCIVDVNGRVVATFEIRTSNFEIDLSTLRSGAYFVRLTGEEATVVRKLIVK